MKVQVYPATFEFVERALRFDSVNLDAVVSDTSMFILSFDETDNGILVSKIDFEDVTN